MKRIIATQKAPAAIGPYCQGVDIGSLVFTSGQVPIDPQTGLIPKGIEAQTKQSLNNVKAILEEAGLSMNDVIKATVYLKNMNEFTEMNKVYESFFTNFPARSTVEVARLPKDVLVEVEVIASR